MISIEKLAHGQVNGQVCLTLKNGKEFRGKAVGGRWKGDRPTSVYIMDIDVRNVRVSSIAKVRFLTAAEKAKLP